MAVRRGPSLKTAYRICRPPFQINYSFAKFGLCTLCDISRASKFRLDQVYLRRSGFWLDLRLILLSFWITGTGAWEKRNRRVP